MDTNTEQLQMDAVAREEKPLGFITRVAYGCGDTACNVVYGMVGTLLTLFYTDYIGINAGSIAVIMLVSRVFDGVSDFIMGFIVERTHSKWGQSRPWVLWMALPYAIAGVLMFTVPQTSENLQLIYIFITYNLCTTFIYTALNLPYGSLSAMMTRASRERDLLSVFRMGMAPFGRILVVSCTLPLVKLLGDNQSGWIKAMCLWCAIAFVLLLFCFARCKEQVVIEARKKQKAVPIGQSLKAIATNQYFWMCLVVWMCMTSYTTVTGTVLPYYCKYILHNDTWMYSALYVSETAITILFTFLCPLVSNKCGKRNLILGGTILAMVSQIVFCLDPYNFNLLLVTTVFRGIGVSPLFALLFGLVGDAVEFGQWKSHIRQEALVFSAGSVGNKLGIGVVSSATAGLLGLSGYISSTNNTTVIQPDSALQMIVRLFKFAPMILFVVVIIVMLFYRLDKEYDQIMADLLEREKQGLM
ncbi:MAG: MFS transporter [Clostridiales bacterium]|nr:MFS transporter [Clostridiales bacterium]